MVVFGQNVHNPAMWNAVFAVLRDTPLRVRGEMLEDITALLVRSKGNRDTLLAHARWHEWIAGALRGVNVQSE
jgi:hypothetical protein